MDLNIFLQICGTSNQQAKPIQQFKFKVFEIMKANEILKYKRAKLEVNIW